MSDSAVRLSDTCCQTVRESAVNAVRLSALISSFILSFNVEIYFCSVTHSQD